MPKNNNIDAYIARRIERELDKNLASLIEKKMRQFQFGNFIKQNSKQYTQNALNDLNRALHQNQFSNLGFFKDFGSSESQLINTFSQEIKNSIFRNI